MFALGLLQQRKLAQLLGIDFEDEEATEDGSFDGTLRLPPDALRQLRMQMEQAQRQETEEEELQRLQHQRRLQEHSQVEEEVKKELERARQELEHHETTEHGARQAMEKAEKVFSETKAEEDRAIRLV